MNIGNLRQFLSENPLLPDKQEVTLAHGALNPGTQFKEIVVEQNVGPNQQVIGTDVIIYA